MIGSLKGNILRIDSMTVLVEVNGVGYEVFMPLRLLQDLKINSEYFIYVQQIIREDANHLFGFLDYNSKVFFNELVKVNGIGPKTALAILSTLSLDEFIKAILQEDVKSIVSVPGIGKKTAERMIVEFKDKVEKMNLGVGTLDEVFDENSIKNDNLFAYNEAIAALVALGYKESLALSYVKKVYEDGMNTRDIIVKALAFIKG